MKRSFTILLICAFYHVCSFAQQTPSQLPSLIDDSYKTPTLENNEKPEAIIRKSIFVKAIASAQSIYVGQPVMVTYKLYACIFCRSRVNRQPSFNGCSVTEMPYSGDPEMEEINGRRFHVYTIRKVQVIPLEDGPLQLGEAAIDNIVPFNREGDDPDNFSITTVNDPLTLNVKPLPDKDKPKDFSGVVGNFTMNASVDTNNLPAGDNATLLITVKGSGNFTGIHLPNIMWPPGTEHFETTDTQHIDENTYPVNGYKTFSVPFITSKEGTVIIPAISFNFYDPDSGSYKVVSTNKVDVVFTKPISREEQMQSIVQEDVGNSRYLWIVGAIAVTVIAILLITTQIKSKKQAALKTEKIVAQKAEPVIPDKDYGAEILSALNRLGTVEDNKHFLSAASYLLIAGLQIKLAAQDASADELVDLLKYKQNNVELANICSNILKDCNRNLYSPDAEEGVKEKIYFELSAVIKKLFPLT